MTGGRVRRLTVKSKRRTLSAEFAHTGYRTALPEEKALAAEISETKD
ncbi:MAG: hypothetical protein NTV89_02110 [Proteobacteria bacterium]|nr:hypothetical protein [Pseudomonadota bacterium]